MSYKIVNKILINFMSNYGIFKRDLKIFNVPLLDTFVINW